MAGQFKIKRKGIEKRRAAKAGISVHQELAKDAKSSNPTRKKEGVLGLEFEKRARTGKM